MGLNTTQYHNNFNPRPPCGGRPADKLDDLEFLLISIHVLRVEDDFLICLILDKTDDFNPRPPCGGRLDGDILHFFL